MISTRQTASSSDWQHRWLGGDRRYHCRVGGGPCGTSTAFNLKRRYPGKAVTLCLSDSLPLPGYADATRRYHRDLLLQQGVSLVTGSRARLPADAELCQMAGGVLRFADGTPDIPADLIIWTTGKLRPHTAFLPRDMLDAQGFVPTDAHLNVPGYQRIFAIGDVAATDPLRCSARNWAYRILCRNIADRIADRPPSARFDPPAARWGSILGLQPNGLSPACRHRQALACAPMVGHPLPVPRGSAALDLRRYPSLTGRAGLMPPAGSGNPPGALSRIFHRTAGALHPAMVSWSNVMSERDKEEDRFLAGFDHVVLNLFSVGERLVLVLIGILAMVAVAMELMSFPGKAACAWLTCCCCSSTLRWWAWPVPTTPPKACR